VIRRARGRLITAARPLAAIERTFDTTEVRSEAAIQRLEQVAVLATPTTLARERVLPVADPLLPLLPGGLVRGSSVHIAGAVDGLGSTSLALAVLAGPLAAGSWAATVGIPTLGLAAAAGFGVDLGRLVLVAPPPPQEWATIVATLLDAFEVVLARPVTRKVGAADNRRLAARARERGSVLLRLGPASAWPEAADVSLTVTATRWEGLGQGHGHLRARRAVVEVGGRRGFDRVRRTELWLPGPGGVLAEAPPLAEVQHLSTAVRGAGANRRHVRQTTPDVGRHPRRGSAHEVPGRSSRPAS
jgi:hypothetical protein